jgi:hypothetical protein
LRQINTVLATLGLAVLPASLFAQDDRGHAAAECGRIADDARRLACYDGLFRAPPPQSREVASPGQVPVATRATSAGTVSAPAAAAGTVVAAGSAAAAATTGAATAAAAATPVEDFGLTEAQKQSRDSANPDQAEPRIESITAVVAAAEQARTGEVQVTLDNGQVWRQADTAMRLFVRPGDTVTIRAAALGSFMLRVPGRPAVRVRRVK